jgi:hypothetical protein
VGRKRGAQRGIAFTNNEHIKALHEVFLIFDKSGSRRVRDAGWWEGCDMPTGGKMASVAPRDRA